MAPTSFAEKHGTIRPNFYFLSRALITVLLIFRKACILLTLEMPKSVIKHLINLLIRIVFMFERRSTFVTDGILFL